MIMEDGVSIFQILLGSQTLCYQGDSGSGSQLGSDKEK